MSVDLISIHANKGGAVAAVTAAVAAGLPVAAPIGRKRAPNFLRPDAPFLRSPPRRKNVKTSRAEKPLAHFARCDYFLAHKNTLSLSDTKKKRKEERIHCPFT